MNHFFDVPTSQSRAAGRQHSCSGRSLSRFWAGLALFCLLVLGAGAPLSAQNMLPAQLSGPNLSLMPYLDYFLDESGSMNVEEVAASGMAEQFHPLQLKALPQDSGVVWLRFLLPPVPEGQRAPTLLLDMGPSVPGVPLLYEPEINALSGSLEWRESSPEQRNVLLLPEAGRDGMVCYIRLDGLPGLWFAPMLRTPHDAATNWGSLARTAAILALAVVMLLCLLRGLSERGQWRVWTALYVAAALAQGYMGMPGFGAGRIELAELAAVLTPGLALMLLPHVGRHLMRTNKRSLGLDIQLILLSLPGAALALLPLIPGYAWVSRYLDIWPLLTLLFVPTALGAWIMGLGGAKRFLLGCLIPPLFVAAGVLGQDLGFAANLLSSAPLWGTALSALLIAATRAPYDMDSTQEDKNSTKTGASQDLQALALNADGTISLDQPLDDPNLRLLPPDLPQTDTTDGAEPASAAQRNSAAPAADGTEAQADAAQADAGTPFNLQALMREVHDAVVPAAEKAGLGLAWYMAPELSQHYGGDAAALRRVLSALLDSAVKATTQGAVHLSVREVPQSTTPGHLLFTVRDTGSALPPEGRSAAVLAETWELAGRHGGFLGVESSPQGTTIAFSLHLTCLDEEALARQAARLAARGEPTLIIVTDRPEDGEHLRGILADQPCRLLLAEHLDEALVMQQSTPALLLIAQGKAASPDVGRAIRHFHEGAQKAGLPFSKALAITPDNSQWDLLAEADYTHALLEPVDALALRQTVEDVLKEAQPYYAPAMQAPKGPAQPGQPPIDSLLGTDDHSDTAFLKMADLTALPDLLSFTEGLHPSRPAADGKKDTEPATEKTTLSDTARQEAMPSVPAEQPEPAAPAAQSTLSEEPAAAADASLREASLEDAQTPPAQAEAPAPVPQDPAEQAAAHSTDAPRTEVTETTEAAPAEAEAAAASAASPTAEEAVSAEPALTASAEEEEASAAQKEEQEFLEAAGLQGPTWAEMDEPATASVPAEPAREPLQEEDTAPVQEVTAAAQAPAEPAISDTAGTETEDSPAAEPAAATASHAEPANESANESANKPAAYLDTVPASGENTDAVAVGSRASAARASEADNSETDWPETGWPETARHGTDGALTEPAADTAAETVAEAAGKVAAEAEAATAAPQDTEAVTETLQAAVQDDSRSRTEETQDAATQTATSALSAPETAQPRPETRGTAAQTGPFHAAAATAQSPEKPLSPSRTPAPRPSVPFIPTDYERKQDYASDGWVGEPVPLGTPMHPAPSEQSQLQYTGRTTLVSVHAEDPQSGTRAYVSPNVASTDTWIGEPTPLDRAAPSQQDTDLPGSTRQRVPVAVPASAVQAPAPHEADSTDSSASIMDFIAGASPIRKDPPPLTSFIAEMGSAGATRPGLSAEDLPTDIPAHMLPTTGEEDRAARPEAAQADETPHVMRNVPRPTGTDRIQQGVSFSAPAQAPSGLTVMEAQPAAVEEPPLAAPSPQQDMTIVHLVERLDKAMEDAQLAFKCRRSIMVGEAASRIALEGEAFGLRILARMARCVEGAAKAGDMNALQDLLPELAAAVERNRIQLTNPR